MKEKLLVVFITFGWGFLFSNEDDDDDDGDYCYYYFRRHCCYYYYYYHIKINYCLFALPDVKVSTHRSEYQRSPKVYLNVQVLFVRFYCVADLNLYFCLAIFPGSLLHFQVQVPSPHNFANYLLVLLDLL